MNKDIFNLDDRELTSKTEIKVNKKTNSQKDIAIIGMAAKLPGSSTLEGFWEELNRGADLVRPLPVNRKKDVEAILKFKKKDLNLYCYAEGGFLSGIDQFDYKFFRMSYKEACLMDPHQRLFLETAWHAIEDAGYLNNRLKGTKTGVFVGQPQESDYYHWVKEASPEYSFMALPGNLPGVLASRVSYLLDLKGPSMLIDTACSSSLTALHLACQSLRNQECETALVGGINLILNPTYKIDGAKPEVASTTFRAKSFDESADGTGSGEGSVALLLKPLDKAIRDKDQIHAVIIGTACNQDGSSIGITAPNALAQKEVLLSAWQDANIGPTTIGYIEAHGTGTKLGDPIEVQAVTEAFRTYSANKQFCSIGSIKANMGHLDSAAGLMGILKTILVLKNKEKPPLAHFKEPNKKINFLDSPVYVNTEVEKWEKPKNYPRRCGVSSFGLSGTNVHMVVEEAPLSKSKKARPTNTHPKVLCISAKNRTALLNLVAQYQKYFEHNITDEQLANACYTASVGRDHYFYRIAIVGKSKEEFLDKLGLIMQKGLEQNELEGFFYSEFHIVLSTKKNRKSNELTEVEIKERSTEINQKMIHVVNNNEAYSEDLVSEIAKEYTVGSDINWKLFYQNEKLTIISLPLYPFEQSRCWIDLPGTHEEEQTLENVSDGQDKIIVHFKKFISKAFEVDYQDVHEDADFFEFGIDSISILQVKQEVLETYGVEVSVEQLFSTMNTIGKLTDYLRPLVHEETSQLQEPGLADNQINSHEITPQKEQLAQRSRQAPKFGEDTVGPIDEMINSIPIRGTENQAQWIGDTPSQIRSSLDSLVAQQLVIMKMQLQAITTEGTNNDRPMNIENKTLLPIENKEKSTSALSAMEESIAHSSSRSDVYAQAKETSANPKTSTNQFLKRFFIKEDHVLDEKQVTKFKELMKGYIEKTKASRHFAEQYRPIWASDRFNQGYTPQWKDYIYPIFVDKAQGSRIWDLDGNEYIDFSMGFGSILLGYNHPVVAEALAKASQESVIIGPVSPKAAEVAELITELTGVERVGFYNTGSEAVMVAIRAARATTGKDKIVIFTGAFHGTFDGVAAQRDFTTKHLKSTPTSLGTPQNFAEDIIVLEYGDHAGLEVIEQLSDEIGAVLVEPVQSRRPKLQPREFLKELRTLTTKKDIALIFDEIVTGFRLDPGGAQAFYGVEADIVTYGKVIGGGMPLGIIAGKAEYINRIDGGPWKYEDDSRPDMNIILSSGTFCAHPVTMTATKALLSYIKENKETLYPEINKKASYLTTQVNEFFKTHNIPIEIEQCTSIFTFKPKRDVVFLRILFYKLIEKGIYLWEGATCFVSEAHTDEDIETFIKMVKEATNELASTGLFSVDPFTLESIERNTFDEITI